MWQHVMHGVQGFWKVLTDQQKLITACLSALQACAMWGVQPGVFCMGPAKAADFATAGFKQVGAVAPDVSDPLVYVACCHGLTVSRGDQQSAG